MRSGPRLVLTALLSAASASLALAPHAAPAQELAPRPELAGFRLSGSFVGSVNYNSHVQIVPEFAGAVPVSSEPGRVETRFDQLTLGVFRSLAPWLSAGASVEVERHAHRHSHGLDPDFGCPGAGPCVEQFGAEEIETEVSLHRFAVTAVAPLGNGVAFSLGRFDVPFGIERHDAALNLTATTSELQRFGRPQSMTGLLVAHPFTPWLDVSAWVVNRWENETTEDPPEDQNRGKSVGGRLGFTPVQTAGLLNVGLGGWWGEEREEADGARWLVDLDLTWSPLASVLLAAEVAYGGESGVSFRERGAPIAAAAVSDRDARWFGAYALAHYDLLAWLAVTARYGVLDDRDGARTGIEQVLQSVTVGPTVHLSRLVPELRPPGVAFARTRHPLDWVDLRLEYRLHRSSEGAFSDAEPGTPIVVARRNAHQVTLQSVVNF